ncbi:puff-specific protein Bx42 isoform X2 [Episyrphus balteatus]|nr:puff-specific protein Bx42 isoform X2 [Episyrphus balteatus]
MTTNKMSVPPRYTERQNWIPRTEADYNDGGAYPEIHVAQYPLDLGLNNQLQKKDNTLGFQLDENGKTDYDVIAKHDHAPNKIVYSNISQLLPDVLSEGKDLQKPNAETQEETTEATRRALEKLTSQKINAAMPCRQVGKANNAQWLRFTSVQQGHEFNSGAKQRVIKMVEAQVDPMEPPKFKVSKKIPRGPPSPPAPVLHSPSRKVSMKEQKEWKVPPCISNWKNAKGYTIPLDKRLAADGRGLQQLHINEKFAKMAEALYIADRKAREAVEARAQLEKRLAQKEKDKKEDMLRVMAQRAREERAGLRLPEEDNYEMKQRDELRGERHRDRTREKNLGRAGPDKRLRLQRERERDITELIALGKSAKVASNNEAQFDQRLFNKTKGMDSGFADDEAYNVYDKPWRDSTSLASHLHRPKKDMDSDTYGMEYNKLIATNKFVPDKEFSGVERSTEKNVRRAPVQFEKEDDPFGLDQFLNMAKKATKRNDNEEQFFDSKRNKLG